jgi:hypothetical protein
MRNIRSYEEGRILSPRQEFMIEMSFHENKREWVNFLL